MALASALAFEAPKLGIRAGAVTIDHGLQEGSAERAAEVAGRLGALGLGPVEAIAVVVGEERTRVAHSTSYRGGTRPAIAGADGTGSPEDASGALGDPSSALEDAGIRSVEAGGRRESGCADAARSVGRVGGPEAAARDARYAALDAAAERLGAAAVLLGHTRDDQAETVLLGLARGSGTRSLSGMAAVSGAAGRYRRPFLHLDRQTARRACLAQSLPVWDDPHNTDPTFTRSRLRHEGLPALEKALGKGVVEALARTARLSRDDADALDAWADRAETDVRDAAGRLECAKLGALPPAVRRRVLRRAAIGAGAPAGSLFARHIEEVDRLITGWRGQGAINLPGKVVAQRQDGRLVIRQG
jgi:tRNA(Ile)-lysidine synthase